MKTQEEVIQELKDSFNERYSNTPNENLLDNEYLTPEQLKTEWKAIIREKYEALAHERNNQSSN